MLTHKPTHNEYTPINPKPFFATIANAQPSIHAANRISKLFAAFVQIAYPLILLARENRGQLSYSLSIHQSNLFSHFSVYSARPCNRWRCCLTPSCTTNSSPMGKREKLACFRAMLASCPIASSPSNRHSCFCFGAKPARYCAKQPVIIAICQAGPAASIQKSSSFRAYYELIIRTGLRTLPDFSFLEWTAFVSLT